MALNRNTLAMYFTGVAAAGKSRSVVSGHYYVNENTEKQITGLHLVDNGSWSSLKAYTGIVHATRYDEGNDYPFLLLERTGIVYRVKASAAFTYENISSEREGFFMDVRKIGLHWYAVGGQHQAFRREQKKWKPIDDAIFIEGDEGHASLLQSVDGTSESNIYAVGTDGIILHFNGKRWDEIDSPTDYDLERVLAVNKGEIYICGEGNALYRNDGQGWLPLTEPDENVTYWDMAYFAGRVFVCSKEKLFVLINDRLEEIIPPVKGPLEFYRLDAGPTDLWTVGGECILQFDSSQWRQHVCPDNELP
jgi:hypothetical protein